MKRLAEEKRNNIKILLQNGKSTREVAKIIGVSQSTVSTIRQECFPMLKKSKGGAPSKLSEHSKNYCVRLITTDKTSTAEETAKSIQKIVGTNISRQTVARALRYKGLKSGEKKRKPFLSVKHSRYRLKFAKRYKDWTVEDWKRVIWSDEAKVVRFSSDGRSWCWFKDGEDLNKRCIKQTFLHGGGSLMIWGCITSHGVGYACKIEGNLDGHLYKSILRDELMQTIKYYKLDKSKVIFQHDNDSKHKSKIVSLWLEKQPFMVLDWPSQSPDLNPIEHLWAHLKKQLNKYESPPKGMLELWERIEKEWEKITKEKCIELIESMPKRIKAVIRAKGRWTKY